MFSLPQPSSMLKLPNDSPAVDYLDSVRINRMLYFNFQYDNNFSTWVLFIKWLGCAAFPLKTPDE